MTSESIPDDYLDDYGDYDDDENRNCQTCTGDGFEWCEDADSAEGCYVSDCDGESHTCPNCHGSGLAKDQWYW